MCARTHLVGVEEVAAAEELVDDEVVVGVILQTFVEMEGGFESLGKILVNHGGRGGDFNHGGEVDFDGAHVDGC